MRPTRILAMGFLSLTTVSLLLLATAPFPSVRPGTTGALLLELLVIVFFVSALRWYWLDFQLARRIARQHLE